MGIKGGGVLHWVCHVVTVRQSEQEHQISQGKIEASIAIPKTLHI